MGFDWDAWIGKPYEWFHEQIGCWVLVKNVIKAGLGVELPKAHRCLDYIAHGQIDQATAKAFDVIMFAGDPYHVGVVCLPGLFLHVEKGDHSKIERYESRKWKHRIEGIYRIHANCF